MNRQDICRISYVGMVFLSLTALLTVVTGYAVGAGREPDEGALAHIFQLAIVALLPTGLAFLLTADWQQIRRGLKRLAVPTALLVLAFAGLYHLEHRG